MKTTIKKAVAAILGCAMLASLCTANVAFAEDRPLHIAYTAMPDALIQRLHSPGIPAGIGYAQISDTLVHKNEEGQFEPRLAERWEINEDASEYTFYLRQDVKWSDGEPLTAEDVVYTMEMLKEAPGFSVAVGNLEKAEAIDDYTVKMTLIKPNVVFLSSLSTGIFTAIHPKHGDEQWGEKYGTSVETTLSCGPYILTDWQPDVSMTFEANPDYYRGEPDIKEVVFHEMQDTNAAVVAMQSGEIDIWFNPITGTAYQTLSTAENVQIGEYISGRNEAIYMYCPSGTFSDVRMRQAVAYGINPEEALLVAADGMGELIDYLGDIGSTMSGNPDDYESPYAFTYDLEKAKALVAECGMEGAPVTVKSYNTEPYLTLGTWLQNVLTNIGLNATVEPMERAAFLEEMRAGKVEILPLAWVAQAYDLDEVLAMSLDTANAGTANYSFYSDPDTDALLEESRAEADPEARKEIYKQIIDKSLEDVPFVPLYAVKAAIPYSKDITCDDIKSYSIFDYHWAE